jgi:molybdopterin-guanine dinucleotide biosynthesis protein A
VAAGDDPAGALAATGYTFPAGGTRTLPPDTDCLVDRFVGFGPIGGLLTALHEHPERAWLVLACDLPLVDADLLANLLAGRRPTALATAFRDPASGLPEPLCTLWEPRSRARIHRFLGEGILCPRKVLVRSTVALLDIPGGRALENVNHPEDYRRVAGKEANP